MAKSETGKSARKPTARPWWRRMRWRRLVLLAGAVSVFLFVMMVGLLYVFAKIPNPNEISSAQSVIVVDHNGKSVGRIHAEADRVSVTFADMPADLRHAVVATEDRRFYSHHGIVITSIFRAAITDALHRGSQGGSTITQQYVKNAFVGNKRSIWRKMKEAVLAVKLEHKRSKDQILEDYLNTIYFGRGAYGCEAAAQTYFGAHCSTLTLSQSATLAGIIRAPELYDPIRDADAARARRDAVLGFMVRDRFIGREKAAAVEKTAIKARKRATARFAAHYLEELQTALEKALGPRQLYGGGVRVLASLDVDAQRAAEDAVRTIWPKSAQPEAAVVAMDPKTGAVRAMVGSRSYAELQLNLATRARRQPGSTFKAAVLAAALDEGISPSDRFRAPARYAAPGYPKPVENYDHKDYGTLSVAEATWHSVNTVYIQLIHRVGAQHVVSIAHELGIRSTLGAIDGLALGVEEVTPLELTNMYTTLAARGVRRAPVYFQKVTVRGKTVLESSPDEQRGVEQKIADNANAVLQGVITKGTGTRANIGRPEAGKTGTTEENVDAWFVGYTPDLAVVAWNGFADARRSLRNVVSPEGCTAQFGGSCPAEMVKRVLRAGLAGVPATPFASPEAIAPSEAASPSPSASSPVAPSSAPSVPVVPSTEPTASASPAPSKQPSPTASPTPTKTATASAGASP